MTDYSDIPLELKITVEGKPIFKTTVCECCGKPMDGIIMHSNKCREYYDDKYRTAYERGHR